MSVEEIIEKIEKQRKIIAAAIREQDNLIDSLKNADKESYEWISVKQAAGMLGVSISTMYNRINSGELSVKHIGAKKFVRKSEVFALDDKYEDAV